MPIKQRIRYTRHKTIVRLRGDKGQLVAQFVEMMPVRENKGVAEMLACGKWVLINIVDPTARGGCGYALDLTMEFPETPKEFKDRIVGRMEA